MRDHKNKMSIKFHLILRTFIKLGLIALWMGTAIYMKMQGMIEGNTLIINFIVAVIVTGSLEYAFLKVPAQCPSCGKLEAYATGMIGNLRYNCKACGETTTTSVISGSGPMNRDYWATQMAQVETGGPKGFSFKRILLFTLLAVAVMSVPLLIALLK